MCGFFFIFTACVRVRSYERVSGTCIGGGTFWGLCRLLTACRDFDEAMELSQTGDPSKCDMLVGDIYGTPHYS
jgi:type II pantothenate kinase